MSKYQVSSLYLSNSYFNNVKVTEFGDEQEVSSVETRVQQGEVTVVEGNTKKNRARKV